MSKGKAFHEVRAPTRIDLAGGTLDIWPICRIERRAMTVNLAISRYVTARVRTRDDGRIVLVARDRDERVRLASRDELDTSETLPLHRQVARQFAPIGGMEIITKSNVPAGSGLGGSSSLLVAMLGAAALSVGRHIPTAKLLAMAVDLEVPVIGSPTGCQDHVGAIFGGLSEVTYPAGGAKRRAIKSDLAALGRRLVLAYTGKPRRSGTNNWDITKRFIDGDTDVRALMRRIADATHDMRDALIAGDLDAAGAAMGAEWAARRELAPRMSTRRIEVLGRAATKAGAIAMKVCGAGGGGCVVFFAARGKRTAVAEAVRAAGGEILRFQVAENGVR